MTTSPGPGDPAGFGGDVPGPAHEGGLTAAEDRDDGTGAGEPGRPSGGGAGWVVAVAALLTVGFVVVTATRWLPLQVGLQHGFPSAPPHRTGWVAVAVAAMLGLGGWLAWGWRREFARPGWAVACAAGLGWLVIVFNSLAVPGGPIMFGSVIVNDASNSYFSAALRLGPVGPWLATYPEQMARLGLHVSTQSAGATLVHWVLLKLGSTAPAYAFADGVAALVGGMPLDIMAAGIGEAWGQPLTGVQLGAALWCGWLFVAAGVATAWPLYALCRRYATQRAACLAVALWLAGPGLWGFTPSIDQVYPLLVTWGLLLLSRALDARAAVPGPGDRRLMLLCGLVCGLALFVNFGFAVLPVWVLLLTGLAWRGRPWRRRAGRLLGAAGWLAAGMLVGLLLQRLAGYRVLAAFVQSQRGRVGYWGRPWGLWAVLNWFEYAIAVGWPATVLVVLALARRGPARHTRPAGPAPGQSGGTGSVAAAPDGPARDADRWDDAPAGLRVQALAALGVLLAVDLSGQVRGETSRMWLLYTPVLLASGAAGFERYRPRCRHALGLFVAQLAGAWGLTLWFAPWGLWAVGFFAL